MAKILQKRGWYVIPSYDFSGDDGDKAPKMQGAADAFPLPDLDVARSGSRYWAEVKTKARADLHRRTGDLVHGISSRHYAAYQRVQRETGCEVWLFVVEEEAGEVLCARLDDLPVHHTYTGPLMGHAGMTFFARSEFRPFPLDAEGVFL